MDLFVNYDCSLQAANLYERTIKCIKRLQALPEGAGAPFPPPVVQVHAPGCWRAPQPCVLRRHGLSL